MDTHFNTYKHVKMKVALVIATCGNKNRRGNGELSESILNITMDKLCLWALRTQEQNRIVDRIIITIPPTNVAQYDEFYDIESYLLIFKQLGIDISIDTLLLDGTNNHHSYDQWLKATHEFVSDYYIFIEDDYTFNDQNVSLDVDLINTYRNCFPDDIGYLCACWADDATHGPHMSISNGIVSKKTMDYIQDTTNQPAWVTLYEDKRYSQLAFSSLFARHVPVRDMSQNYMPFWDSSRQKLIYYNQHAQQTTIVPIQYRTPRPETDTDVYIYGLSESTYYEYITLIYTIIAKYTNYRCYVVKPFLNNNKTNCIQYLCDTLENVEYVPRESIHIYEIIDIDSIKSIIEDDYIINNARAVVKVTSKWIKQFNKIIIDCNSFDWIHYNLRQPHVSFLTV